MHRIKVVEMLAGEYLVSDETIYSVANFTEWDEVSDEDFQILKDWAASQNRRYKKIVILEEKIDIPRIVADYLKEAKEANRAQAEREAKLATVQAKRKATLASKKLLREKRIFEELKTKFS